MPLPGWLSLRASSEFPSSFSRTAWLTLDCAHRTSTFLSYAFCEQEGHLAASFPFLARISFLSSRAAWLILIARNFFTRPPTGRYFSPALPSDCFAIDFPGRAISPGEGLLIPQLSKKE